MSFPAAEIEERLLDSAMRGVSERKWEDDFGHYVALTQQRLLRQAERIVRCWHTAQDVVQRTYLELHETLRKRRYRGGSLQGWLMRATVTNALEHLRKAKVRKALPLHDDAALSPEPGPEERLERAESLANAWRRVAQLPPRQRDVLILRLLEAWDYPRIADELDATVEAVSRAFERAMARLRKTR